MLLRKITIFLCIVIAIFHVITSWITLGLQQEAEAIAVTFESGRKAPIAISGDNIYITWWTNKQLMIMMK